VRGGVEAIYDRHRYQAETKVALALWAEHVMAVVEGRAAKVRRCDYEFRAGSALTTPDRPCKRQGNGHGESWQKS
jgi:hypothetical protein